MHSLNQEDMERTWSQISDLYIKPELVERSKVSPIDLSDVRKVLIKLPKNCDPIVEINEEARFLYAVEDPIARTAGETLESHEIMAIKEILPPKVDDHSVAFIYAWRARNHVYFAIDFSPNRPDFDDCEHKLGDALSIRLYYEALETIMAPVFDAHQHLASLGVPLCAELIPYPLNRIAKHISDGAPDAALSLIEVYCNNAFVENMVQGWYSREMPNERKSLYDQALKTHALELYDVTINALMGRV